MAGDAPKSSLIPQAPAFDPAGTPVPEADQPRLLAEGKLNFAAGSKVVMTMGDRRGAVSAEHVPTLMKGGWRPEMPSETSVRNASSVKKRFASEHPYLSGALAFAKSSGDTFNSLATAGLGDAAEAAAIKLQQEGYPIAGAAVSALTPGGYGRAAEKLSPGYAQAVTDAVQYSPKAALAGKVAGAVGALVAPNPFSVAGTLVRGADAGTNLAKIASLGQRVDAYTKAGGALRAGAVTAAEFGAMGALEGAGYSMGAELEAAVRARQDITAERLLSAGLTGGAIGGAFGGVLGGIGGAFKSKFARSLEEGALSPESYVSRAFGLTKAEERKLIADLNTPAHPDGYKEFQRRIFQEHENAGILNNANAAEIARINDLRKAKAIAEGSPFLPLEYKAAPIDPLKGGVPQAHQALASMRERAGNAIGEAFQTAEQSGLNLMSSPIVKEVNKVLEKLSREGGVSRSDVNRFRSTYISSGVNAAEHNMHITNQTFGTPAQQRAAAEYFDMLAARKVLPIEEAKTFAEMQRARREIDVRAFAETARTKAGGEKVAQEIRRAIESGIEKQLAKNPKSFDLYMAGKKEFSLVRKVDDFLKKKAAESHSALITGRDVFGAGLGSISGHVAFGAHAGPLGMVGGAVTGLALEKARKGVNSPEFSGWMARRLNSMRGGTDATAIKLAKTINGAVSKDAIRFKPEGLSKFAAAIGAKFSDASRPLRNIAASPALAQNQLDKVNAEVSKKDRGVARATTQKLIEDIAWLQQKMPQSGTPGGSMADVAIAMSRSGKALPFAKSVDFEKFAGAARMSPSAMNSFINYYRSLNEPLAELSKIQKSGRINPALPEVLRERRPVLLSQIRAEIQGAMGNMASQGKMPARATRVTMSMLTGDTYDVSMKQSFIKGSQDIWAELEAERLGDESAGPTPGTRTGGRQVSARMRERAQDRASASEDVQRRRD